MYNMGDTTYKSQPKFMSIEIITALAHRLKKHCTDNKTTNISFVFHGGEPLLLDKSYYEEVVPLVKNILEPVKVYFQLQSNGTLLDYDWCRLFKKLDVQVGISVDGPEAFQNKYRVYHNNKGSFADVMRGIKIRDEISIGGLISVINTDIKPEDIYEFYLTINAKKVNILLPDNHYDNLPKGKNGSFSFSDTTYGDWLIDLYDEWSNHESKLRPGIPFFENIMNLILGEIKGDELIGKKNNGAVTIETNGDIEVVDPLRTCGNGFTRNTLNVFRNEIAEIEKCELFKEYYFSHERLSDKCLKCPIQNVCGGGYLGHRFSAEKRFNNPSIYCNDLMKLITHIQNDIVRRLPTNVLNQLKLEPVSYEEVFGFLN